MTAALVGAGVFVLWLALVIFAVCLCAANTTSEQRDSWLSFDEPSRYDGGMR
jgi:hypothetical protein